MIYNCLVIIDYLKKESGKKFFATEIGTK